ncbi:MAG: protein-disulfide reductase DsbD [Agitococcus sp.]|nr:protein-disulfide reductase DsbD [Agitococcus sp.]
MPKLITTLLSLLLLFSSSWLLAEADLKRFTNNSFSSSNKTAQFLTAEQAFTLQAEQKNQELILKFNIAPNYYLYKERFKFEVKEGNAILGQAFFSEQPEWKDDAEFGRVQVFHQSVVATLPVKGNGDILIRWQGCADAGLCYAPQEFVFSINSPLVQKSVILDTKPSRKDISIPIPTLIPLVSYDILDDEEEQTTATPLVTATPNTPSNTDVVVLTETPSANANTATKSAPPIPANDNFSLSNNPLLALLTLYALGIGLAFTPCVLPMLPIVANIVARQHASTAKQGFFLAFAYGVGVACSYGLLGVLVSLFGSQANIATWLQHPSVLLSASALFFILALASFDVFHLQLPQALHHWLDQLSKKGKAGSFVGTWLMGFFSALVVSPCVSAPLAGVLLSVSTLGNPLLGGIALFALGFGLSTPLMILGASEGKFMPKAGLWLNRVKQSFGVLLLGVAIVLLSRVITGSSMLILWAALSVGSGFWLNQWGGKWRIVWRSGAYMLLIWGATLLVGAALGATDPLKPLDIVTRSSLASSQQATYSHFKTIHSLAELDENLTLAQQENKKVLVDFYADWCVSCKIMSKEVFEQADVQSALQGWILLKADVTKNTKEERALQQQLTIFGPPAVLFFSDGQEVESSRLVGEVSKSQFMAHLQQYMQ